MVQCSNLAFFRKGSFGTADESNVFPVRQADRGPLLTLNPAKIAIMKSSPSTLPLRNGDAVRRVAAKIVLSFQLRGGSQTIGLLACPS
jgi:hypothetical protein